MVNTLAQTQSTFFVFLSEFMRSLRRDRFCFVHDSAGGRRGKGFGGGFGRRSEDLKDLLASSKQ
jgi:hypothetical protein